MKTCLLCGDTNADVVHGLVRWIRPDKSESYGNMPRCRDREACKRRTLAQGEPWPEEPEVGHGRS